MCKVDTEMVHCVAKMCLFSVFCLSYCKVLQFFVDVLWPMHAVESFPHLTEKCRHIPTKQPFPFQLVYHAFASVQHWIWQEPTLPERIDEYLGFRFAVTVSEYVYAVYESVVVPVLQVAWQISTATEQIWTSAVAVARKQPIVQRRRVFGAHVLWDLLAATGQPARYAYHFAWNFGGFPELPQCEVRKEDDHLLRTPSGYAVYVLLFAVALLVRKSHTNNGIQHEHRICFRDQRQQMECIQINSEQHSSNCK